MSTYGFNGGSHENNKVIQAFKPLVRATANTLYNGVAAASSASKGIDLQGFDEVMVIHSFGLITAAGSVVVTPQTKDADTNTVEDAVTVTSSDATSSALAVATTDDDKTFITRIRARDVGRYLFIKRVQTGAVDIHDSVVVVLSKASKLPVVQGNTIDAAVSVVFKHLN